MGFSIFNSKTSILLLKQPFYKMVMDTQTELQLFF